MIKTEEDYEKARLELRRLGTQQTILAKIMLEYENKHKVQSFTNLKDLKSFIEYESSDGSLVIFEGITYKVGDIEDLKREYGYESVEDGMNDADLDQLVDGSIGILEKQ